MREVTEKMRQKLENGEEESIEEGDDSDKAEYGSRGPSSPDLDEMADLGFGRANPSQHETAFLEVAEKEVKRKKKLKKKLVSNIYHQVETESAKKRRYSENEIIETTPEKSTNAKRIKKTQ